MMLPIFVWPLLEEVLNRVVQLDPASRTRLVALENSSLQLHIKPLSTPLRLAVYNNRLQFEQSDAPATVQISGDLSGFVEAHFNKQQVRAGALQISGDIASAQAWQLLLSDLKPEWASALSPLLGDTTVSALVKIFDGLQQWAKNVLHHQVQSAAQYATEEQTYIVSAAELNGFAREVDRLRDDAERLLAKARQKGFR